MEFPKEEERILAYWKEIDAFQTSLKLNEKKPPFRFYDGMFRVPYQLGVR